MTTDRTAAPTRGTALADRPASAAGRTPAPPADTFSALLGAATPKSDAPARRDDDPRRDDHPRADKPHRADDTRRPQRRDEAPRPAVAETDEQPAAEASTEASPATPVDSAAAEETPTVPTAPSLFALQLASPLPPQTATPVQAPPAETPPLPVLAGQIPASLAAATAAPTTVPTDLTGAVAASVAGAAAAPATVASETPGAIALAGLPAEATADTMPPADLDPAKPQAQAPAPVAADVQAKPAQDTPAFSQQQQQTPGDAQPQDQPSAPAPANGAAPQAKPAEGPAPAAAPAQPATASPIAPATAPGMPSTPNVQRAVPLSRALVATGVMVHMMADKGVNHARLNLKPAELGGIEVRLRSTGDGVHALLVADSPEAARMLASAGDDLKRQLEDKNVNLLSLDVSTSDGRQEQPAGFSTDGFGDGNHRPGSSNVSRSGGNESALLMETPEVADTVLVLPDGVHVDVLA